MPPRVDELEELGVKSIEDGVWDCEFLGHISNPGIFMRLRRVYWGLGENEKGKTSWGSEMADLRCFGFASTAAHKRHFWYRGRGFFYL